MRFGKWDSEKRDLENGIRKRQKRDLENGIRKMGFGKTGFGIDKNWIRKTGFGKLDSKNGIRKIHVVRAPSPGGRPSSRSGSARQKWDHLCLCSAIATQELQAHQQDPLPSMWFPFLCVRHEQASGGAPLLHALQPGHAIMRHLR